MNYAHFQELMLHSVVQDHFLCDHCLLCIRTWDALYIVSVWCGLRNGLRIKRKQKKQVNKQRALLRKLGNHKSVRKRVTVSPISQCPYRETFETRALCWLHRVCVPEEGPYPFCLSCSPFLCDFFHFVQYKSNLFSEDYRQKTGILFCLQELSREASFPEPLGLRESREIGGPSFRRVKVSWEAVLVEPFSLGEAGSSWSRGSLSRQPRASSQDQFQMILFSVTQFKEHQIQPYSSRLMNGL